VRIYSGRSNGTPATGRTIPILRKEAKYGREA